MINMFKYKAKDVVTACKFCNFAKSKGTQEDFMAWIERVKNNGIQP